MDSSEHRPIEYVINFYTAPRFLKKRIYTPYHRGETGLDSTGLVSVKDDHLYLYTFQVTSPKAIITTKGTKCNHILLLWWQHQGRLVW
jgi:hypothetical protein